MEAWWGFFMFVISFENIQKKALPSQEMHPLEDSNGLPKLPNTLHLPEGMFTLATQMSQTIDKGPR